MSYLDGLVAKGARLAGGRVVSFGDVERETAAALGLAAFGPDEAHPAAAAGAAAASVTPLLAVGVLRVTGPDARDFLHGQLAADVRALAVAGQVLSLLLNHKGHALADVAVLRAADGFLLLVEDGKADQVFTSLVDHIVFDDVSVSRAPGFASSVQGAAWGAVVGALGGEVPEEGRTALALAEVDGASVHALRRRRSVPGGADLLVVGAADADEARSIRGAERLALAVLERLVDAGGVLVGEAALAAARVEALVPAAAFEGGDGVLPQEAGMVERLSYRKGCYLGQEIMARIEARGNLKRALALLSVDGLAADDTLDALEAPGSSVALDGRPVGRLGTLARLPGGGATALAVLRRDVPEGATLDVLGAAARIRRWQPL